MHRYVTDFVYFVSIVGNAVVNTIVCILVFNLGICDWSGIVGSCIISSVFSF